MHFAVANWNQPFFVAFAANQDRASFEINRFHPEVGDFRHTHS